MATSRGIGYAEVYLMGRRQALEQSVKRAEAVISDDETRHRLERTMYIDNISAMDKQILEYDKLLADARKAQSELAQPRMGRVTRSSQREQMQFQQLAAARSISAEGSGKAAIKAAEATSAPASFTEALDTIGQNLRRAAADKTVRAEDVSAAVKEADAVASTIADPFQRAAAYKKLGLFLQSSGGMDESQAERAVLDEIDPAALAASSPEAIEERREQVYTKAGGADFDKFNKDVYQQAVGRGAYLGGGGVSSVTSSEALPGEAARMGIINSAPFKATANALRDDGVISDAERAALVKAGVTPEDYLDLDLMQAIARTGKLEAERSSLAGRRTVSQEDLAAMVAPDASMQRQQELTSMFYGPGGVTPTQAFFQPRKVQEGITKEAKAMSAKQAMIKGFVRAAKGDVPELTEDDNVYASQLTEAINSGNHAVKQSFRTMTEAGVDEERVVSAFGVASRRARELDARRKAQAAQAAQPLTE